MGYSYIGFQVPPAAAELTKKLARRAGAKSTKDYARGLYLERLAQEAVRQGEALPGQTGKEGGGDEGH